uniref:Uncharacterized protein n=1 Tax=Steinernema glaseri TaxID=37863 RepID=A0A1I7YF44_9BILA
MSESSVFSSAPSFVGLLKREELEGAPHHVDDIVRFTVEAENLLFSSSEIRGKVLSLRRYRSLMHKCRFAAIRGLTLGDFRPDTLDALMRVFLQPQFSSMTLMHRLGGWIDGFVDRLVSQWLESPETFTGMSKFIGFPYQATFASSNLLSRFQFRPRVLNVRSGLWEINDVSMSSLVSFFALFVVIFCINLRFDVYIT